MKKNIKNSISVLTIMLSLTLGYIAYAGNTIQANGNEGGKRLMGENREATAETEEIRDEFRKEFTATKDDIKANKEQYRVELEQMIQSIKEKRQEFKLEIKNEREAAQLKITEMRNQLKDNLKNIKDENKKISVEKIADLIQELNTKITNNLSDKVDQIENVLVGIESRMSKAKDRGIDVSSLDSKVTDAKASIEKAREAIKTQANKVYTVNVTSETTVKSDMKVLRDTFKKDIDSVREIVKNAHVAVKNVAVALAQIPNVDDAAVDDENVSNN